MSKIAVTVEGDTWGDVVRQMEEFVGRAEYTPPAPLHAVSEAHSLDAEASALPQEPPHVAATFAPFPPGQSWPPGECPVHHKPFKDGAYGPFCSAQGGNGPLNKKGYCDLKPGMQFNGKTIPVAA